MAYESVLVVTNYHIKDYCITAELYYLFSMLILVFIFIVCVCEAWLSQLWARQLVSTEDSLQVTTSFAVPIGKRGHLTAVISQDRTDARVCVCECRLPHIPSLSIHTFFFLL